MSAHTHASPLAHCHTSTLAFSPPIPHPPGHAGTHAAILRRDKHTFITTHTLVLSYPPRPAPMRSRRNARCNLTQTHTFTITLTLVLSPPQHSPMRSRRNARRNTVYATTIALLRVTTMMRASGHTPECAAFSSCTPPVVMARAADRAARMVAAISWAMTLALAYTACTRERAGWGRGGMRQAGNKDGQHRLHGP